MADIVLTSGDALDPPAEVDDSPGSGSAMLPDEALPAARRGRGRPPGAKNKAKPESDPEPPPVITLVPIEPTTHATKKKKAPPPPPESESEEDSTPPLPAKAKAKPKKRPKPETTYTPEPISPHSQRVRSHAEVQSRRQEAHNERINTFSSMLDKMVGY